ncbi:UNVERIFIED_CONTAM: hypothetical protein NCL1_27168 [Trichonephila clavipes]
MTHLDLKTFNIVPCYYHHTLPTMWEALNNTSLIICRTTLAISSRVANHLPRIGSLILGMISKSQDQIKSTVTFHRISSTENSFFDVSWLLKTGYFHLTRHSPTD